MVIRMLMLKSIKTMSGRITTEILAMFPDASLYELNEYDRTAIQKLADSKEKIKFFNNRQQILIQRAYIL